MEKNEELVLVEVADPSPPPIDRMLQSRPCAGKHEPLYRARGKHVFCAGSITQFGDERINHPGYYLFLK